MPGTSLGRGRPHEVVRNDIYSYSPSNEQNNINQYVKSNNNNVEGTQGGVNDEISDHSDFGKGKIKKEGAITQ